MCHMGSTLKFLSTLHNCTSFAKHQNESATGIHVFPIPNPPLLPKLSIQLVTKENNIMEKTRDLFKKIRDTKGTFHAKMGSIEDRNGMDLTEAEDIKRWQEYREELYKKIIMTKIITMV